MHVFPNPVTYRYLISTKITIQDNIAAVCVGTHVVEVTM